MKTIVLAVMLVGLLVIGMVAHPVAAQDEESFCVAADQSTEEVVPGVYLTYDSSFLCAGAPVSGEYEITVHVHYDDSSVEKPVTIETLLLSHTTPRPRFTMPHATAETTGLPLALMPSGAGEFMVSGVYELVQTGEGMKANLHLRAVGYANTDKDPFILGINVMLRSEDHDEMDDPENGGPPSWAPGPPPWADRDDNGNGGPPSWAPGPPPWAGDNGEEDDDNNGEPPSSLPTRRP
jgi:ABC-type cobalt transport system substrate-binding protein